MGANDFKDQVINIVSNKKLESKHKAYKLIRIIRK